MPDQPLADPEKAFAAGCTREDDDRGINRKPGVRGEHCLSRAELPLGNVATDSVRNVERAAAVG